MSLAGIIHCEVVVSNGEPFRVDRPLPVRRGLPDSKRTNFRDRLGEADKMLDVKVVSSGSFRAR